MNAGVAVGRAAILFVVSAALIAVLIFGIYLPGRKNAAVNDAFIAKISSGNDKERAAAALSSAEIGDERLIGPAVAAFSNMKEFQGDMILAVGRLRADRLNPENVKAVREFLIGILEKPATNLKEKRLALWASGNLRFEAALPFIERMLTGVADISTLCVGIDAMGEIGSKSSSSKLEAGLYRFNKEAMCPETTYVDSKGRDVVLSSKENIALKMLHALFALKDPSVREDLVKMSKDTSFPEVARNEAARLAATLKK